MKKGQFYKVLGGDFGVRWNGRKWEKFECVGCLYASGVSTPSDRLNHLTAGAEKEEKSNHAPVFLHNKELHKAWLLAGKPLPFDYNPEN